MLASDLLMECFKPFDILIFFRGFLLSLCLSEAEAFLFLRMGGWILLFRAFLFDLRFFGVFWGEKCVEKYSKSHELVWKGKVIHDELALNSSIVFRMSYRILLLVSCLKKEK
ncbi:MAG: hypothetical protein QG670_15 [Thermoproteota archaeon]|nr:hypothetical protein [Thermoproteota archaeon]